MMRRFFYMLPFVVILATLSCSKENTPDSSLVSQEPLMSLTIPASKAAVKTVMAAEDGSVVHWSDGDALVVFDDLSPCGGHRFDGTVQADAAQSQFSGEVHLNSTHIYALYPYDAVATFDGTNLVTTLPTQQTATLGSFANGAALAFGQADVVPGSGSVAGGLDMQNLCAVISFKMPSYVDGAQQVVVTSLDGKAIAGTATLNVGSGSLSVSGSSSVTVGVESLAAGTAYYAAVAPGSYPSGFSFRVKTASGKEYTATNPNAMQLSAGGLYSLGTPGLVLNVTPTVTITHTTSNGLLSGSSAVLSPISVDDEWASMITGWSVELRRGSTVVRRLSASSGTMSVAGGWNYLPQGNYDIVAKYTSASGAVKQVTGTAVSPAPSFSVTLGGYTNYDYYAGTNGCSKNVSTANSLDAATVYSPSVSIGISETLLNDDKYTSSWSYSYDGGAATGFDGNSINLGNKTGQSWAKHTLTATCSFDGVTKNASRDFHVTGLPWSQNPPAESSWNKASWNNEFAGGYAKLGGVSGSGACNITTKFSFYCPANIGVRLTTDVYMKSYKPGFIKIKTTYKMYVAGSQVFSKESSGSNFSSEEWNAGCAGTGTISSSNSQLKLESSYTAAGPYVKVVNLSLQYN